MSWKKYGGTNKLEKYNNLAVSTIVTDRFTLKDFYIGDWDICGGLTARDGAFFGSDVNVAGSVTCQNINILGTLGVFDTLVQGDLIITNDVIVGQDLYLGGGNTTLLHGENQTFGFNTFFPEATLDISSGLEQSFYIKSSAASNKNVIAQNATNDAITVNVEPTTAYIDFYVDGSLNLDNNPDARLLYEAGGNFTIDVSNTLKIRPRTIFSQDLNRSFLSDERMIIYSEPSVTTPYFPEIYNEPSFKTGTTARLVAGDNSSNTFIKIATESGNGMAIGGGYFLNNRIMGIIALTDETKSYPAMNIITSSNLNKNLKTSIAVNKPTTTTIGDRNRYAMDINGPIKLVHQELIPTFDTSFAVFTSEFYGNAVGIAIGASSTTANEMYFCKSTDGGYTWTRKRIVDQNNQPNPNSLEVTPHTLKSIYMVSETDIYIAGESYFFHSINGGDNWSTITYINSNNLFIDATAIFITPPTAKMVIGFSDGTLNSSSFANNTFGDTFGNITTASFIPSGLTRVQSIHGSSTNAVVAIAGYGGIRRFNTSTNAFVGSIVASDQSFNSVNVYNNDHIVAVGKRGIIYYTHNAAAAATWSSITIPGTPELNRVKALNELAAIAVGDSGKVLYSVDGYATWSTLVIDTFNLTHINIVNPNDFVITLATATDNSRLVNLYAPDLLNRSQNNIVEASGNIVISGDLQVNDAGQILTNNTIFNLLPTNANEINIGHVSESIATYTNVKSNLTVLKDTSLNQRLFVQGDASFNSNITVMKDTSLNQRLFVQGDASFNSNIMVMKDTSLNQRLFVQGDASFNSNITVMKDTSLNQRLFVQGDASFNSNITVMKDTSLNQRLFVQMDASFNKNVYIANDLSVNRYLFVTNRSLFSGDVSLSQNLSLTSALRNNSVAINKDISSSFALDISGITMMRAPLYTLADVSIQGKLFATQDVSFNENAYVGNDLSVNRFLYVKNRSLFDGDVSMSQNLSLTSALRNRSVAINKDISSSFALDISGITMMRAPLYTLADVSIQGKLFTSQDVSLNQNAYIGNDLSVNRFLYVKNRSLFDGDVSLSQNLSLTSALRNNSVAINKDISSSFALDISGITMMRAPLYTLADVSIQGKLFTAQDVSFNQNAYIGNDLSVNRFLYVKNRSLFDGDVSLSQNLSLTSALRNRSVAINKDISSSFALDISGITMMRAPLYTLADVSIQGKLFTTQDVSLNQNAYIGNDLSVNRFLYVKNRSLFDGDVSMSQNLSLTSATQNRSISINKGISSEFALDVNGIANFRSPLYVLADVSIQGKLFTTDDVSFNKKLTVGQTLNTNTIDSTSSASQLTIGGTNAGNITIKTTSGSGNYLYLGDANSNVQINGNLFLPGSITSTTINNLEIKNKTILLNDQVTGANQSAFSGLNIRDNDVDNAGYFLVNGQMNGFLFKSQKSENRVNLDVSGLSLASSGLTQGFVVLKPNVVVGVSADYTITTGLVNIKDIQSLDTSLNRRVERNPTTTTATTQVIDTKIMATGLYVNKGVDNYIANSQMDINGNAFISKLGLGTSSVNSSYTLDVAGSAKVLNNLDVSGSLSVQTNIYAYGGTIIQW
jgi:photosystem II stability/assembly factor-like uncharacterized protein